MKRVVIGSAGVPVLSWTMNRDRSIAGLGALSPDQENPLRDRAGRVYTALDALSTSINNLAATGAVNPTDIGMLFEARAALREQLDALLLEIDALSRDSLESWNTRLGYIERDVAALAQNVAATIAEAPAKKTRSIILWTAVAVGGAVGAGLLIRYWGKRRG